MRGRHTWLGRCRHLRNPCCEPCKPALACGLKAVVLLLFERTIAALLRICTCVSHCTCPAASQRTKHPYCE